VIAVIVIALIISLVAGPTLWVRTVMRRHGGDRPDFPGTGGEFARHLLDEHGLQEVDVEITTDGDHYDGQTKKVRLSRDNYEGRSVTAVAVAAHEVGHALQDRDGYRPLAWRGRLVGLAGITDRFGSIALLGLSVVTGAIVSPRMIILGLAAVVLMGLIRVAAHAVTLPVEFDASFGRALPIIQRGRYLHEDDEPAARSVLKAAACTYVAASLIGLINLLRILRALR
jgi:hypothetical protein